MKLALAEQIQRLDQSAINDHEIPGIVLMENAGKSTVDCLIKRYGDPKGRLVVIFIGPGNNGGDGLVMARHLHQLGADIVVYILVDPQKLTGDALVNYQLVNDLSIKVVFVNDAKQLYSLSLNGSMVVDALFGTGLKRRVEGIYGEVINRINQADSPVIAVDIPSGIASDTGQVLGVAIQADLTVSYALAQPGHYCLPGKGLVGELVVVDIGIPSQLIAEADLHIELIDDDLVGKMLPVRSPWGHKGSHGHLLLAGGMEGKSGAIILAARGALRSGAGLVTIAGGRALQFVYETALPEAMTILLAGQDDGALGVSDYNDLALELDSRGALVIGPGLGMAEETVKLVRDVFCQIESPVIVDADALNCLARERDLFRRGGGVRILTPHPGEMARMTGLTTAEIQADRLTVAADFAIANQVYLVLKGAATVIAAPDGRVAINHSGNDGMGCGGMGDVLAGVIGGLLVQGVSPWQACCSAVYCHGRAADMLAVGGVRGFLAGEVADILPQAMVSKPLIVD